jgi:hypothetical protein
MFRAFNTGAGGVTSSEILPKRSQPHKTGYGTRMGIENKSSVYNP